MALFSPLNLMKWVEENRDKLRPPVGNALLFSNDFNFKIMIVGGPNTRSDYHIDAGEEIFYQVKGDMLLKIVDPKTNEFKDVPIKEGEMFILPSWVPHSPQRFADTVGLVIERARTPDELDGLRWYCDNCKEKLYEEFFHCVDLGAQLKPVIERFYGNEELRTCKKCSHISQVPKAIPKLETEPSSSSS